MSSVSACPIIATLHRSHPSPQPSALTSDAPRRLLCGGRAHHGQGKGDQGTEGPRDRGTRPRGAGRRRSGVGGSSGGMEPGRGRWRGKRRDGGTDGLTDCRTKGSPVGKGRLARKRSRDHGIHGITMQKWWEMWKTPTQPNRHCLHPHLVATVPWRIRCGIVSVARTNACLVQRQTIGITFAIGIGPDSRMKPACIT